MSDSGVRPEIFQGMGGFVESGHFDRYFVNKTLEKKDRRRNWKFFLLDTLETTP